MGRSNSTSNGSTSRNEQAFTGPAPLSLAVGPPQPLSGNADKQAYQRELYTVTVGAPWPSDFCCTVATMSGQTLLLTFLTMTLLLLAAICANVVIFVAKLVTYLFSGSR